MHTAHSPRPEEVYLFRTPGTLIHATGPLTKHTGSSTAALLVLHLEYWFSRKPKGFYKFLAPCAHELYKHGDSWEEQMGLSKDQLSRAFTKICKTYKSKTAYRNAASAGDPFGGMMYLSFIDKRTNITHYLRNHRLAYQTLTQLGLQVTLPEKEKATVPETPKSSLPLNNTLPTKTTTSEEYIADIDIEVIIPETTAAEAVQAETVSRIPSTPVAGQAPAAPVTKTALTAFFREQRGWGTEQAEAEAIRFIQYYQANGWKTANGYPIADPLESARRWRPERTGTRLRKTAPNALPTPVYRKPEMVSFPDEWEPQLYARLKYLNQLDYMAHLEKLGWQKVRPPQDAPPLVDRWFVLPSASGPSAL